MTPLIDVSIPAVERFMRSKIAGKSALPILAFLFMTAPLHVSPAEARAENGIPATFECVLPYVSGGGTVTLVSASGKEQSVEVTVMNAYKYTIVVPGHSSYSFQSPVYQDFFSPVVHGGPLSFKSEEPLVVYTVLAEDSVTIPCSDPRKRTKVFVGGPNTGIAIVNTTKTSVLVRVFRETGEAPIFSLTLAPEERRLGFLQEIIPGSGTHTYRLVAESDGVGLAAVSYARPPAAALPIAESTGPPAATSD
jgi:hypothetical protein